MIQAFFFDLSAINGGSLRPEGVAKFTATKVGVLGAGMMGAGIAYSCARAGMQVVLKDVAQESADKGKAYSEKILAKAVERGKIDEAKKAEVLDRITATTEAGRLRRRRPRHRGRLRGPRRSRPGCTPRSRRS